MPYPKNAFVFQKTLRECEGKSDLWIKQAVNEILNDMKQQIERDKKAPHSEQLDRIESSLMALKYELKRRGVV